jgi:hypothetical protein
MGTSNTRKVSDQIIRVGLEGFSGSNQAMLEYCIAGSVDCDLTDAQSAQIIIINGDQPLSVDELYQSLMDKFADKIRIVISIRKLEWQGFHILTKPHTVDELLSLIRHAYHQDAKQLDEASVVTPLKPHDAKLDFYQSKELIRKRRDEALRQKLKRGSIAISAADRLVQQLESSLVDEKTPAQPAAKADAEKKAQKPAKKKAAPKPELSPVEPLSQEAVVAYFGNLPDVDLSKPEERRRIFVNTEGMLIEKMLEAVKLSQRNSKAVEITGLPGTMVVLPEKGAFVFSFSNDFLNQMALTRFAFGELALQELDEFILPTDISLHQQDTESLIWELAIWTAKGRLFHGIEPEKTVQLVVKPDFTRFLVVPKGEEIADLWSGRKMSAVDVAGILDVPQRFIFAFMSGGFSLGWFQD